MTNWIKTTIGEQATLQRGIDITKAEQHYGTIPVISSGGVSSYHDTAAANGPGVLLGRKGVVGSVYYVDEDYWPHDTSLWVKDFHGNHPRFVYYFFKSVASLIARMDVGSANPTLNRNHVHPMPILWPPLSEQKAIAVVLGALDDKIALNGRTNATLEAMARALFQSWFVDFGPVRAKAEGRPPAGLDGPTAALFPAQFQPSELGAIPQGWAVKRIDELAVRVAMGPFGSNITRNNFREQGVPVIRGGNLTDGFVDDDFVFVSDEKAEQLKNSIAQRGDLVFTHRGTLGQIGMIPQDSAFTRYVVSQSQMLLRLDQDQIGPEHVYQFFRSPYGQRALLANTSQVGVPAIARPTTSLKSIQIVVPSRGVSLAFERQTLSLRQQFSLNAKQSRTLATLRDMLLPKLLSGCIRCLGPSHDK